MKIKLFEIVDSISVLNKLQVQELPAKTAYKVQKNIKEITEEIQEFETIRTKLVEKYSKENKDGIKYIPEENMEKANIELTELLQEEIEINISKININDLSFRISPLDLAKIDWMIEDSFIK